MKIKDKYPNPKTKELPICPDCKSKVKRLIQHHIITHRLAKYLIEVQKWDMPRVLQLRRDLQIFVCQKCEKKFHNGEFYTHNPYPYEKRKNIELHGDKNGG